MNICICDDNLEIIEELESKVKQIYGAEQFKIERYTNGAALLQDVAEGYIHPKIIFMDIKLDDLNGIDVAKNILNILFDVQIIFITGYDDYYFDVYEIKHAYIIRKPLSLEKIKKAIDKALEYSNEVDGEIYTFTQNRKVYVLKHLQILFFEKIKRKICIHTVEGDSYEYYGKMSDVLESLPNNFLQCHNSYIININQIKTMSKDKFRLQGDYMIPISRAYKEKVKEAVIDHIERNMTMGKTVE